LVTATAVGRPASGGLLPAPRRKTYIPLLKRGLDGPDDHRKMFRAMRNLLKDESGATAVEYGLIVAAIAGLIIVVVFLLGKKVNNAFSNVASHMP
jgi:pilus assembly protein Flp/PilA